MIQDNLVKPSIDEMVNHLHQNLQRFIPGSEGLTNGELQLVSVNALRGLGAEFISSGIH